MCHDLQTNNGQNTGQKTLLSALGLKSHMGRWSGGLRWLGKEEDCAMAWTKPKAREVKCGMEINMYGPGEDDDRGGERDVI